MASESEIRMDIEAHYGAVVSQSQVRRYLCVGSDKCRAILADVPYLLDTQTKRYFAMDVAKKLFAMQVFDEPKGGGSVGGAKRAPEV